MSNSDSIRLELAEAVWRSSLKKGAGITWPVAIDRRLDELVERAAQAGQRTNRAEMAAALVLDAPSSGEELSAALARYRRAKTRDALLQEVPAGASVVAIPRHRPGPRRATG